jgi:cell division protein FtsB
MHKIIFIFFIIILVLINLQLYIGTGGYNDDKKIKNQIVQEQIVIDKLKNRNYLMEIKISGIKGSTDALEARSRNNLNMIKNDEMLIILPGNDLLINNK